MDIKVPRVNPNDDEVDLVSWVAARSKFVAKGEPLADIETSKTMMTVYAPCSGLLEYSLPEGSVLEVGQVMAVISEKEAK